MFSLFVSCLALCATCLGWYVTYRLSASNQKQGLLNSLTNDARRELTTAIRDFHDWCSELSAKVDSMPFDDITSGRKDLAHHETRSQCIIALCMDERQLTWARRLEEYELLFPGTSLARMELLQMTGAVSDRARKLARQHGQGVVPTAEERNACIEAVLDVLSLTWDMLIYLQNESIGRITGRRVPERAPTEPRSIRLRVGREGTLLVLRP
jgi:hypothetical protein